MWLDSSTSPSPLLEGTSEDSHSLVIPLFPIVTEQAELLCTASKSSSFYSQPSCACALLINYPPPSPDLSMEQWRGKVAFVTGASAGIGYDLSKQLCELGVDVVGCARNIGKIEVSAIDR